MFQKLISGADLFFIALSLFIQLESHGPSELSKGDYRNDLCFIQQKVELNKIIW